MAVIHSDVKAQLRCNENNFTTDWRDTVTPSLRDKGRGLEACRKYLIAIAEINFPPPLLRTHEGFGFDDFKP